MIKMDFALEKGLAAEKVKVGHNNKDPGYAIKSSVLRTVVYTILGLGLLLVLAFGITYHEMLENRAGLYFQTRLRNQNSITEESQTIARGVQLSAALNLVRETEKNSERAVKRIKSVTDAKSSEIVALLSTSELGGEVQVKLSELKDFIDSERSDMQKEFAKAEKSRKETLDKISKSQVKSLNALLSKVSDSRLDALDELLNELFDKVKESVAVDFDQSQTEQLADLVDRLYQEDVTPETAMEEFNAIRKYFKGGLPAELEQALQQVQGTPLLADALDDILSSAVISPARQELIQIQKQYDEGVEKAGNIEDLEDLNEAMSQATVDAFLKVQEMINEGKLSETLLDLNELDDDDDDDDEDDIDDIDEKLKKYKQGTDMK